MPNVNVGELKWLGRQLLDAGKNFFDAYEKSKDALSEEDLTELQTMLNEIHESNKQLFQSIDEAAERAKNL